MFYSLVIVGMSPSKITHSSTVMMTIIYYAEMSTQDFLSPNSSAFEVLILLTEICEDPGRVIL